MKNSHRMGGKLDSKWDGPYTVNEKLSKGRYHLRSKHGVVLKKLYSSFCSRNTSSQVCTVCIGYYASVEIQTLSMLVEDESQDTTACSPLQVEVGRYLHMEMM